MSVCGICVMNMCICLLCVCLLCLVFVVCKEMYANGVCFCM